MFDETLSWWAPQHVALPNSKEIEEKLYEIGEQKEGKQTPKVIEESMPSPRYESKEEISPWQTRMY